RGRPAGGGGSRPGRRGAHARHHDLQGRRRGRRGLRVGQHLRRLPGRAEDVGHVQEEGAGFRKRGGPGQEGRRRVNANLAAVLYIVSGVLFILALRGLSSPTTSQAGNRNGMIGMAIAVGVTLATLWGQGALDPLTLGLIAGGVAVGGIVGAAIARRVAMTAMPQLVAAFHSLVGMAACLVAVAAIHTPAAYGIVGP